MLRTPHTSGRARLATDRSREEHGATAVEYAIMVGFIVPVIMLAVASLGSSVDSLFEMGAACFP